MDRKNRKKNDKNGDQLRKKIKLAIEPQPVDPVQDEPAQTDLFCGINDDCIYEILTYLKFKDLCAIGKTNVRLNQLAANEFQRKYPSKLPEYINVRINDAGKIVLDEKFPKCFLRCISILQIPKFKKKHSAKISHFLRLHLRGANLRKICIQYGEHLEGFAQNIKSVLTGVEILQFYNLPNDYQCGIVSDMLQYCTQLEELEVDNFKQGDKYGKYPTIKLLRLSGDIVKRYYALAPFLRQNPNISKLVWYFDQSQKTSIHVINVLFMVQSLNSVRELYLHVTGEHIQHKEIYNELKALDERTTFERLEIFTTDDPAFVASVANQNLKTLTGLHLVPIKEKNTLNLNFISQFKFLHLIRPHSIRIKRQNLQNLEIVCIDLYSISSWTGYMILIANCPKLKKLIIRAHLCCNAYFGLKAQLPRLNEIRSQLQNAYQMVIYVVTTTRYYCDHVSKNSNYRWVNLKSVKQLTKFFDSYHPLLGAILNE